MDRITLLGRECNLLPTGRNTVEVVPVDEGELTEAQWAEYCRFLRLEMQEKKLARYHKNRAQLGKGK